MNAKPPNRDAKVWQKSPPAGTVPEPGYDKWLAAELAAGQADLDTGPSLPLAKLRKEFGLE